MENNFGSLDFRLIIEFCKDLSNSILEKDRVDLKSRYFGLVEIGQTAYFLQAVIREKDSPKMGFEVIHQLAASFGIFQIGSFLASYSDNNLICIDEEGGVIFNLNTYNEMIDLCKIIWERSIKMRLIDSKYQLPIVFILYSSLKPRKFEYLRKFVKEKNILKEIINDCISLGLLNYHESGYYYSPKIFKSLEKDTLSLLTEFDITSNSIIDTIEKIDSKPAYPLETLNDRIQEAIKEGAFKGVLEPIQIKLIDDTTKYFIFANPEILENGELPYETAAYFRYNEVYALAKYGRLEIPMAFMNKLIRTGSAGDATNIGLNYTPLEIKGVIKVVEGSTSNTKRMISLKPNVLSEARDLLKNNFNCGVGKTKYPPFWMTDQSGFRAKFSNTKISKSNQFELLKLLRDSG
jgi:hypothetical protein